MMDGGRRRRDVSDGKKKVHLKHKPLLLFIFVDQAVLASRGPKKQFSLGQNKKAVMIVYM
jgi:hypothetical protein